MRTVVGLMVKDFLNIKSYRTTLMFLLLLYAITSFANDNIATFIPICVPLLFGMLGISSFSYDSIAKADKYVLTLPITKKDMVRAKYLYIFILTVLGTIVGIILSIVLQIVKTGGLTNIEDIIGASVGALLGMMLFQIFEIPVMYIFGAEKGRIIQMVAIVLIMFIISGISILVMKVFQISLDQFLEVLVQYGIAIITAMVALFYIISYKISLNVFIKKEV